MDIVLIEQDLEETPEDKLTQHLNNEDDVIDQEKASSRNLEKEFIRSIIEIFLYLTLFFIIFSFSSKNAYIEKRFHSNENLKHRIQTKTTWNSVIFEFV